MIIKLESSTIKTVSQHSWSMYPSIEHISGSQSKSKCVRDPNENNFPARQYTSSQSTNNNDIQVIQRPDLSPDLNIF